MFDELHRAIHLDDPIRTNQLRMFVPGIERVLRGTGSQEIRHEAMAAILAVLARAYVGGSVPTKDQGTIAAAPFRMAFANLARKYFLR